MKPIQESTESPLGVLSVHSIVRLAGLVIIAAGLYVSWQVVTRAWSLFENHEQVAVFGAEFEKRSGVNGLFHGLLDQRFAPAGTVPGSPNTSGPTGGIAPVPAPAPGSSTAPMPAPSNVQKGSFRETVQNTDVSYLCAWGLTLILLSLISRIALLAVVTGAKLATQEGPHLQEIRMLAQELARAVRQGQPPADLCQRLD